MASSAFASPTKVVGTVAVSTAERRKEHPTSGLPDAESTNSAETGHLEMNDELSGLHVELLIIIFGFVAPVCPYADGDVPPSFDAFEGEKEHDCAKHRKQFLPC
jgi:hypothetical protein